MRFLLERYPNQPLGKVDPNILFTPFRISNAQWQQLSSLIYAPKRGVLIEKRCKSIAKYFNKFYII